MPSELRNVVQNSRDLTLAVDASKILGWEDFLLVSAFISNNLVYWICTILPEILPESICHDEGACFSSDAESPKYPLQ
jgi:hypothetical protein